MLFLLLVVLSCKSEKEVKEIKLTKPTMVSIFPDSIALNELQEKWDPEDFVSVIDDVMWYHSELMTAVDSFKMEQLNTEKRKVKLTGGKNHWEVDMDTSATKWRYIYFDGTEFLETNAITMKELLSN